MSLRVLGKKLAQIPSICCLGESHYNSPKKMTINEYCENLEVFLRNNPWSKIENVKSDEEGNMSPSIIEPWGDDSIAIILNRLNDAAIKRLNGVILMPSFSAVFHRRKKSLEFIFTPYRQTEIDGRVFTFSFEGRVYTCCFKKPSFAVFDLASANEPQGPSTGTDYRNLRQFRRYISLRERHGDDDIFNTHYKPVSFWVEGCTESEQDLVRLAQHLNFYMIYFDCRTPTIQIHESLVEDEKLPDRERYLWDSFPSEIKAKSLDPYLLAQMASARQAGDVYRRFIYYYQILEYAGFYYLSDKLVRRVESVLKSPDTPSFPRGAWQRIQDILAEDKMQDTAKIAAVVTDCVDAALVWRELEPLRKCFEKEVQFDGGYVVKPCISQSMDLDGFKTSGLEKLIVTLRNIRNALVHAREQRMANVISPTRQNHQKLLPFIRPLTIMAQSLVATVDTDPLR